MGEEKTYRVKYLILKYLPKERIEEFIKADEANKTGNAELLNGLLEAYKEIERTEMIFPDDGSSYHVCLDINNDIDERAPWKMPDVSKCIPRFFFWHIDDKNPKVDYNMSLTDWGFILGAELNISNIIVKVAPIAALSILMEMTAFGYSMEIIRPKIEKGGIIEKEFLTEKEIRKNDEARELFDL